MSDRAGMRDLVWLAFVALGALCGLWAGITKGFPPAVFSMMACWVLAITWFMAGRER